MLWERMSEWFAGISFGGVQFGVGLFLQSAVLIGIGLLSGWLLRSKGAAIQSSVYRTTLAAVILCPFASLLLDRVGVQGFGVELSGVASQVEHTRASLAARRDDLAASESLSIVPSDFVVSSGDAAPSVVSESTARPAAASDTEMNSVTNFMTSPTIVADVEVVLATSSGGDRLGVVVCLLMVAWLAGSCFMLWRLLTAHLRMKRLISSACEVGLATTTQSRVVAEQLGVRPPSVRQSPFVASPCLVGLSRPVVLLPEDDAVGGKSARGILIHELAHLVRRDHVWNLLGRLSVAILFFQPLLWLLVRRIVCTAEEVCDDYVVDFGLDRQDYARHLVDVAERYQPHTSIAAVGVISLKSLLGRRVTRILDGSRTLSIRAGARAMVATIVMGSLAAMLVGLAAVGSKPADATASAPPSPLGPIGVAASADGKTLYVAAAAAKQIAVVDAEGGAVWRAIDMPAEPTGLVLSGDGATLYVTCAAPEGTVVVVDVKSGKLRKSIPVGHWPIGPAISPDGKTLYVCNRFDNNVAVVDLRAEKIVLVPTTREPFAAAVTPDGKSVFVINHLPLDRADSYDVAAVVTVIDTATNKTQTIRLPNGSTAMRGICVSPDGKYVYATHIRANYQCPTTQVERGWMNKNALSIIDAKRKKLINTVLLDDVDLGAANPWGVGCTADSKTICVAHAGTHELTIIDAEALLERLLAMPEKRDPNADRTVYTAATVVDVRNDLAFLNGLRRRVRLSGAEAKVNGPRGLAVVGSKAFVAAYFTDNLAVVDLQPNEDDVVGTIALGPVPAMSVERRGEMLFSDATLCLQHWQSCASCHPDARVDALNWDMMNDGLGNPKNARSMVLAHGTPPSMASGVLPNAEAAVRSDMKHALFADRVEEEAAAIDEYLRSLEPVPSPHLVDGKLSSAARRGRKLFFDAKINCAKCHGEPLFTDMLMHDVGSRGQYDRRDTFDTPTLIECWRTAPYLHDGRYTTLKDLFAQGRHGLQDNDLGKLSKKQIRDLVEYVLSL